MATPATVFKYEELMNDSERSFLIEKRDKEKAMFMRTIRTLSVIFIVLPCCLGIIMESISRSNDSPAVLQLKEQEDPYYYLYYFFGMLFLLLVVAIAGYYSYNKTLKRLEKDIRSGNKTVEQTEITRKLFMNNNNTYHFYLKSTFRLSIEVSKEEYEQYLEGDEINIEYSSCSGIYFGYF